MYAGLNKVSSFPLVVTTSRSLICAIKEFGGVLEVGSTYTPPCDDAHCLYA